MVHKHFLLLLLSLRIDIPPGIWYSIVTERKPPEIRNSKFQEKPLTKQDAKATGSKPRRVHPGHRP